MRNFQARNILFYSFCLLISLRLVFLEGRGWFSRQQNSIKSALRVRYPYIVWSNYTDPHPHIVYCQNYIIFIYHGNWLTMSRNYILYSKKTCRMTVRINITSSTNRDGTHTNFQLQLLLLPSSSAFVKLMSKLILAIWGWQKSKKCLNIKPLIKNAINWASPA